MSEYFPTPLDSIPHAVALPFALYVRVAGRFVKFREVSDQLTPERVKTLGEKTDVVFISEEAWKAFLDYLESICDVDNADPEKAAANVHSLLVAYGRHLEQMKVLDRTTIEKLRRLSYRLVEITSKNPQLQKILLKRYKETSVYFSGHSSNVAVYAIAIGRKLGLKDHELKDLSFGCLVHNVGNSLVPERLLYKNSRPSEEEFKILRAHAYQGAQLLQYLDAPSEVVLTARQHHEHMDGRGYPLCLTDDDIHPYAKICSIADVYDALTSHKPYGRPPLAPSDALAEMRCMKGKFDPAILNMIGNA